MSNMYKPRISRPWGEVFIQESFFEGDKGFQWFIDPILYVDITHQLSRQIFENQENNTGLHLKLPKT